jgi:two-component system sensor histidine kinase YesM
MSNELQKQLNHELQMEDYKEGSIGLRNVNKRIKLNFGSEYGLKIESEEDKYTSVSIHIPNIKQ